jgi:pyridoxine 5-phosphate synthase
VPAIELHTGDYAHNWRRDSRALDTLRRAAATAKDLGLAVHAGHGLTYLNVKPGGRDSEIEELSMGHSIVSRAVLGRHGARRRGDGGAGHRGAGLSVLAGMFHAA